MDRTAPTCTAQGAGQPTLSRNTCNNTRGGTGLGDGLRGILDGAIVISGGCLGSSGDGGSCGYL